MAKSVRLSGRAAASGTTYEFDLAAFSNGDFDGSITVSGYPHDLTFVDNVGYEKSSVAYYLSVGHTAAFANTYGGKWVVLPAKSASGIASAFGSSVSFKNIEGSLLGAESKEQEPLRTTFDGHQAISVKTLGALGTLYLGVAPPYYPLALNQGGDVTAFSDWNSLPLPAPPQGAITPNGT